MVKTRVSVTSLCANLLLVLAALILSIVSPLAAQQQDQKRTRAPQDVPPTPKLYESDLAKENYDRVAASAAQIKAILVTDPGLMVELKRWIAKEATDNGQAARA